MGFGILNLWKWSIWKTPAKENSLTNSVCFILMWMDIFCKLNLKKKNILRTCRCSSRVFRGLLSFSDFCLLDETMMTQNPNNGNNNRNQSSEAKTHKLHHWWLMCHIWLVVLVDLRSRGLKTTRFMCHQLIQPLPF